MVRSRKRSEARLDLHWDATCQRYVNEPQFIYSYSSLHNILSYTRACYVRLSLFVLHYICVDGAAMCCSKKLRAKGHADLLVPCTVTAT